jgi:hypothetical protein
VDVYLSATLLEQRWFWTDASGVYTVTLNTMTDQDVRLEYRGVGGYARQFYDRKLTLDQSDPVSLRPGLNQLTSRLLPAPKLVNTLLDDASGLPLRNASGWIAIYSGTLYLESNNFTTDANGVFTTTLSNTPVGQGVRLEYGNIGGYAHQYYDRQPTLVEASAVTIAAGETALTTHLVGATTLVATLLDDATGRPIQNAFGSVLVYSGTSLLD